MTPNHAFLKITSTPGGEAPVWVREQWIGLELPLVIDHLNPVGGHVFGVLSGTRNRFLRWIEIVTGQARRMNGYVVSAPLAIEIMAQSSPEAAQWWRDNAPQFLRSDAQFMFDTACGRAYRRESNGYL